MKEFEYEELRRATQEFSPSTIVGKGSHGCVYKGVLEDGQVAAIKKCSLGLQKLQDNSKLENEVNILSSMPKNPNVVSPLGTSRDDHDSCRSLILVMEFLPHGSLHDLLHTNSSTLPMMFLSWSKRVQISLQIAKALQFLHSLDPKVIHRDIKSTNVLFDQDWNATLADFGLAVRRGVDSLSQRPAGTIGYLDPCYTSPCMLSTKNDVFSFGVLMLEIISGQKVIDPSRSATCIVEWALLLIKQCKFELVVDKRVEMPLFMEGTIRDLLGIAARCLSCVAICDRPSMDEIVFDMEKCCLERVRYHIPTVWVKFLRRIIVVKRGRRTTTTSKKRVASSSDHVSLGKLMLKDVLADVTLQ